jgi:hypothetical protein
MNAYPNSFDISTKYYRFNSVWSTKSDAPFETEEFNGKAVISLGTQKFLNFANGSNSFGSLVRDLYHEFVHVQNNFGINGFEKLSIGNSNRAALEITAIYSQLNRSDLPAIQFRGEYLGLLNYASLNYRNMSSAEVCKYQNLWINIVNTYY